MLKGDYESIEELPRILSEYLEVYRTGPGEKV